MILPGNLLGQEGGGLPANGSTAKQDGFFLLISSFGKKMPGQFSIGDILTAILPVQLEQYRKYVKYNLNSEKRQLYSCYLVS